MPSLSTPRRLASRHARVALLAVLIAALPGAALAQPAGPPAQPIAQPADFGAVRARYENLTAAQVQGMGYALPAPACISAGPLGAMGFHVISFAQYGAQYGGGRADAQNPPIVLVDATGRVRGVEWEVNQNAPTPTLFGQTLTIQPGHEGTEDPHYMLHGYFRPNGQVLFSDFDPQLTCPAAGTLPAGFQLAAPAGQGAPAAQPAPAQAGARPAGAAPAQAPAAAAPAAQPAAPAAAPAQAPRPAAPAAAAPAQAPAPAPAAAPAAAPAQAPRPAAAAPAQAPAPAAAAPAAQPAPVQMPAALPRTGDGDPGPDALAPLLAALGAGLAGTGYLLRRRAGRS